MLFELEMPATVGCRDFFPSNKGGEVFIYAHIHNRWFDGPYYNRKRNHP